METLQKLGGIISILGTFGVLILLLTVAFGETKVKVVKDEKGSEPGADPRLEGIEMVSSEEYVTQFREAVARGETEIQLYYLKDKHGKLVKDINLFVLWKARSWGYSFSLRSAFQDVIKAEIKKLGFEVGGWITHFHADIELEPYPSVDDRIYNNLTMCAAAEPCSGVNKHLVRLDQVESGDKLLCATTMRMALSYHALVIPNIATFVDLGPRHITAWPMMPADHPRSDFDSAAWGYRADEVTYSTQVFTGYYIKMSMLSIGLIAYIRERFPTVISAHAYRTQGYFNVIFKTHDRTLILSSAEAYHYLDEYKTIKTNTIVDELFKILNKAPMITAGIEGVEIRDVDFYNEKITWIVDHRDHVKFSVPAMA